MATNLMNADVGFPQFTAQQSSDEKISTILNYLYMLMEQLKYAMSNIDMNNMNKNGLDEIGDYITKPVYNKITDVETGLTSAIQQTAESITLVVTNMDERLTSAIQTQADRISLIVQADSTASAINLTPGMITAISNQIDIYGAVTFTDLSTGGRSTINGANITTGYISANRIAAGEFDGFTYADAGQVAKLSLSSPGGNPSLEYSSYDGYYDYITIYGQSSGALINSDDASFVSFDTNGGGGTSMSDPKTTNILSRIALDQKSYGSAARMINLTGVKTGTLFFVV